MEANRKQTASASGKREADFQIEEAANVDGWHAAGNLLMTLKPSGFAAAVLDGFGINIEVFVRDEHSGPGGRIGSGFAASCASGLPSWPGWPAVGNYSFAGPLDSTSARGTMLVLSNGIDPSFYTRTVGGAIRGELACGWHPSRNVLSEHFLASLAGEASNAATLRASAKQTILWTTDSQYIAELRHLIDAQEAAIDNLMIVLANRGLLNDLERRTVRPILQVWIADDRAMKSGALPALAKYPANVRIFAY